MFPFCPEHPHKPLLLLEYWAYDPFINFFCNDGILQEELIALGEDVIYVLLNAPALKDAGRSRLVQHSKEVFHLTDDRTRIEWIQKLPAPHWKMSVVVHEGRKLKENHPDGTSNPYCELTVLSDSNNNSPVKFWTSVKEKTLDPQWDEVFEIDTVNPCSDFLQISVRDHPEDMHLKEQMKQIEQVKGVKGAFRLMRNIAQSISPTQQTNGHSSQSLLGKVNIKLSEIPAGQTADWFSVERKSKISFDGKQKQMVKKGELRLTLNCSGIHQTPLAPSTLRLFFKAIVQYEVEKAERETQQSWKGDLSEESTNLLNCYLGYWDVTEEQKVVASWLAAWQTFKEGKRLDYVVLRKRLIRLPAPDDAECLGTAERSAMCGTLMDCWSNLLRDVSGHRFLIARKHVTGAHTVDVLLKTLKVVGELLKLWGLGGSSYGESEEVAHALSRGNHHWYQHIVAMAESNNSSSQDDGDHDVKVYIEVVENIAQDLYDGRSLFQWVFYDNVGVDYLSIAFKDFESKIINDVKPMVKRCCEELGKLSEDPALLSTTTTNSSTSSNGKQKSDRVSVISNASTNSLSAADAERQDAFYVLGAQAFELYLAIQRVVKEKERSKNLVQASKADGSEDSRCLDYHNWFEPAMYYWIRIARRKASARTAKAIELDSWSRLEDNLHSMSATNTVGIFHNIVIFWKNLDWPDPKGAFVIACHVMRCIAECGEKYGEEVSRFLEQSNFLSSGDDFEITPQLCAALSSIEYVKLILRRGPDWLDGDRLLSRICNRGRDSVPNAQIGDGISKIPEIRCQLADRFGKEGGSGYFRGFSVSSNDLTGSEDMRKVRRGSGTMLAPPLLTSSPGSSMRKSGKDPHISTRKIVNAMAEIMKSVCDSPTGRIGSFSATGDESMPGAMTCESVEDDSKTSGYDTNETYSDTSSESGQTIPSDPDKLRNMLTSTRRSLTLLMESGVEQLDGKLTRLRRAVVNKLVESLMVSLQECCKNSASTGSLLLDRALTRIDNSLSCLHSNVPDSICRDFLDQVWASYLVSAEILADKFPNDASLLLEALASMNAICGVESPEQLSEDTYSRLESKLRLRSISTPDLILKYYHTRRKNAADATVVTGLITVQACRTATGVFVYVLNGRGMQGHGRDTPCSYISIRIFGRWCDNEESLDLNKGKTPVQKVTKTPLYEHEINLKIPEQADCKDAVLIVTANDQHHFKRNYFLGEAVLPISEISEAKENVRKYDLPQICLPLTLPGGSNEERDILNLLQSRTDDKLATEFEKKQRRRIPKLRHGMMGSYLSISSNTSSFQ